ncbi:MAG: anti-sigma factor [Xanthobacteraceae bacterium]|nr:anti-sigma factor [Xanthobacteraceae bacterium]
MTPCSKAGDPDWTLMIQSFFDGELDAIHSLQVETHLATCPSCAGEIDRLRTLKQTVARKDVSWRAPAHVRAQVMEALAQAADKREPRRAVAPKAPSPSVAAMIRQWLFVPSLAALAASLLLVFGPLQTRSSLEDEIVASHIRSTLVNHLTDVQTSDRHTVKPWFNGKIDFAPPVTDLAAQGFPLVGGRVDYVGGRVVAALVYRRHGHVINLFVWPSSGPVARTTARDGYTLESWTSNGLAFVAVSDTGADDINTFRLAFVTQTEIQRSGE